MLREHQLVALILSLHDSFSSSKGKLAPPASFTRPHKRRWLFSMGMITCPPLVVLLLVGREGDETLNYRGAHRRVGGAVASSSVDLREGAACRSSLTEAQLLGVRPRGMCAQQVSRASGG